MSAILQMIKDLLASKKFVAMVSGLIVTVLAKWKLNIDPTTVAELVAIIVSFIIGQGIADTGKEAAKIQAVSDASRPPVAGANAAVSKMASDIGSG